MYVALRDIVRDAVAQGDCEEERDCEEHADPVPVAHPDPDPDAVAVHELLVVPLPVLVGLPVAEIVDDLVAVEVGDPREEPDPEPVAVHD